MPVFLDRIPFSEKPDEVIVRGERVRIREHQIIVWISLTGHRFRGPNPSAIPFPAILDTGYNHSFSIQQRHLIEWAGIRPEALDALSERRDRERNSLIPFRRAKLWMHVNERSQRDRLIDRPARYIDADQGIAIYPEGTFPRLPLLGLRAIAENGLILKIDGQRREATLRTPRKWWPFR